MLYTHNQNNDLRTSMKERTQFLIKKYISHTLFSKGLMFLWCVRDGCRDIYSERENLFFLYLLPGARVRQRLHPLSSSSETPLIGCVSLARKRFSAFCLNLTASFSSHDLLPVMHLFNMIALTRYHLPVYESKYDSLPNHTGSLRTSRKSKSYVI